jgi:CRP-like cAMP-binding protein
MADQALLAVVPFLASLREEQREELAQACRRRTFKPGDVLFYEDDPGSALYILHSGRVKIVRLAEDGAERILHLHGPGEHFGELSLIDGEPRSARAVALEPVDALMLYRDDFLALLKRSPGVALAIMSGLAGMVRRLSEQVHDLTALDVPGRLAKKLLELSESHGQKTDQGIRIALPLKQEELAQMIGATRVAVNQSLSWFRERGVLSIHQGEITLHQPAELRKRIY